MMIKSFRTIKKSNKTSKKKVDLIVKAYEDYLFYNSKEAFEEYWRKRKELTKDKDWKDVDSKIKDTIEDNLNVELKKSGIDIKEVSNNLADDILSIHEGDASAIQDGIDSYEENNK